MGTRPRDAADDVTVSAASRLASMHNSCAQPNQYDAVGSKSAKRFGLKTVLWSTSSKCLQTRPYAIMPDMVVSVAEVITKATGSSRFGSGFVPAPTTGLVLINVI